MRCQSYKAQTLNAYYSIIKCNKLSPEDDHIISSQNVVKKKSIRGIKEEIKIKLPYLRESLRLKCLLFVP